MAEFIEVPPWAMPGGSEPTPSPDQRPTAQPKAALPVALTPTPHIGWVISYGTSRTAVVGSGLVGRNPAAALGEVVDHLIAVGDGERSVSKTHLTFGVDEAEFWVVDRNSTNGSVVVGADGTVTRCEPGVRVAVTSGSRIRIGDVELQVNRGQLT